MNQAVAAPASDVARLVVRPDFARMSITSLRAFVHRNAMYLSGDDVIEGSKDQWRSSCNMVFDRLAEDFVVATEQANQLRDAMDTASKKLQAYPAGAMGLTPDAIKFSPAFQADKMAFDAAMEKARSFNATYTKRFKDILPGFYQARRLHRAH